MSTPANANSIRRQSGQPEDTVMVVSTVPDVMLAKRIAHILVEESLVACAHIGSAITAMYIWEGELDGGEEIPISFKTSAAVLPALYQRYLELHPFSVPEFLIHGVVAGNSAYLDWVKDTTLNAKTNKCIEYKQGTK